MNANASRLDWLGPPVKNVALFLGGPKICNEIHSDWRDPPPFSPKKLPKKNATQFFGSEMTPPHSEVFRKFIEFGPGSHP